MTPRAMGWNYDEDRTYHGVQRDDDVENDRIDIELAEYGPTERAGVYVLETLYENPHPPLDGYQFGWGYNGGGTSAAALIILRDALGEEPSKGLREDFCEDVLSQFCDEFRIRRGAVLRWVRGWYAERSIDDLPRAVRDLPPLSRLHYDSRPEAIRQAQRRKSGNQ
jgi:hypothetical protein